MATRIKSSAGTERVLGVGVGVSGDPYVEVRGFDVDARVNVDRADFIAAVETELDGIFISRADLPPVTDVGGGTWRFGPSGASLTTTSDKTAADARAEALELLALAEHLDAHPPVDKAEVEALARVMADEYMSETGISWQHYTDEARRLVARGVRVEVSK